MLKTLPERLELQLKSLEKKTKRSRAYWMELVRKKAPNEKNHQVEWLTIKHNFSNAEAKALVTLLYDGLNGYSDDNLSKQFFRNGKEYQKEIYDRLLLHLRKIGPYHVSVNQTYISLLHRKQFAILKPTNHGLVVGVPAAAIRATRNKDFVLHRNGESKITYRLLLNEVNDVSASLLRVLKASFEKN